MRRLVVLLGGVSALGCAGFYDEITLHADGSGTYQLTVIARDRDVTESIDAIRSAVQAQAERVARAAGFDLSSVDVHREGTLVVVRARAAFRSLAAFAHPALSVSDEGRRWSFVTPRKMTFADGRFVATVLRESAPGKEHPLRAAARGHEGRFTVYLPGDVLSTNGRRVEHSASWSFSLDQLCDGPVSMEAAARVRSWLWAYLLAGVLLAGLAASVYGLFRRARPRPRGA